MFRSIFVLILLTAGLLYSADSWIGFDEGLKRSKSENKIMVIDFYTDWCHWCKVMDEKTFNEANVKEKLLERFVTVRINAEDADATATYRGTTYNNVELTRAFGVTGYPSLAFLEADGDIITVIPGFQPPEMFIHILNYLDEKLYEKKMPFEEFLKLQEEKTKSRKSK